MKNSITLLCLSVFLILNSCQSPKTDKVYEVHKISENVIKVDGILEKPEWKKASVETDFRFPWLETAAPFTEFRALYNESTFYFIFQVNDTDIVINDDFETELDILPEDRVEIFMARDRDLKEYYGFEIDPLGRVLDYSASYYRQYKRDWTCAEM
ncbi:hypothetical protein GF337_03810, partial [candidate division KSB1 bacterium]|nr:hypothetical protein [candidate division KSB1 bacterium]